MSTVSDVRDQINSWLELLEHAVETGAVTKVAYNAIKSKISSLSTKVDELAEGGNIIEDAELVVEIGTEATELGAEVAALCA